MEQKSENTEWCIFDLDFSNYSFSLNRNSLNKIKNWEKIKSTIYHNSYLFKTKEDLQERMKKELIIWLLWNNDWKENSEIKVEPYEKESSKVIIRISNNLLENLINYEWNSYEYCFNSRGNKMIFYINSSTEKEELKNEIEELNKKHSKN